MSTLSPRPLNDLMSALLNTLASALPKPGGKRAIANAPTRPAVQQALEIAPGQSCWLFLTRGEVLHLSQGCVTLRPQSGWFDAWLGTPAQPLRAGEVWVAARRGQVLLQAQGRTAKLLRRAT